MVDENDTDAEPLAFSGEVWTDARGYANVALPHAVGRLHGSLDYELRPLTPGVTAQIAAELSDGRFTIATDEPHVKVAWTVRARGQLIQSSSERARGRTRTVTLTGLTTTDIRPRGHTPSAKAALATLAPRRNASHV